MKSCSTDDQLGSAHGPRTVPHEPHVARFCPERNPTGMYQPTAGFTGRAPVSASAGVPCGRTDSSFVLRIRNSTKQQPRRGARGGGRTLDGTRPPRDRLRLGGPRGSPLRTLAERYRIRKSNIRGQTGAHTRDRAGVGGQWPVELDPRRRPAGRRAGRTCPGTVRIVRSPRNTNYQKLATFLTHLTTSRRYLDTHKLQQSLQQKTQRKGACPRVRGCV